jgi:hypothetical protein
MQEIIESFLDILQDSIGGDGNEIGMSGSCVPQKQKWRWNFTFVGVCSFYCFSNRHNIIMSVECGWSKRAWRALYDMHCQKPLGDDEAIYMKVQPTQ